MLYLLLENSVVNDWVSLKSISCKGTVYRSAIAAPADAWGRTVATLLDDVFIRNIDVDILKSFSDLRRVTRAGIEVEKRGDRYYTRVFVVDEHGRRRRIVYRCSGWVAATLVAYLSAGAEAARELLGGRRRVTVVLKPAEFREVAERLRKVVWLRYNEPEEYREMLRSVAEEVGIEPRRREGFMATAGVPLNIADAAELAANAMGFVESPLRIVIEPATRETDYRCLAKLEEKLHDTLFTVDKTTYTALLPPTTDPDTSYSISEKRGAYFFKYECKGDNLVITPPA